MTQQEFVQYFQTNGVSGAVSYLVDHNPRSVYDYIQRTYPLALPNWIQGLEMNPGNRKKMADLLITEANKSGNPLAFVGVVASNIEYNPNPGNWTKHT